MHDALSDAQQGQQSQVHDGATELFNGDVCGYDSHVSSSVNGRPFIFNEIGAAVPSPANGFGWWYLRLIANKPWPGK